MLWADFFIAGVFTTYIVTAFWYLSRTTEDKNDKQQH